MMSLNHDTAASRTCQASPQATPSRHSQLPLAGLAYCHPQDARPYNTTLYWIAARRHSAECKQRSPPIEHTTTVQSNGQTCGWSAKNEMTARRDHFQPVSVDRRGRWQYMQIAHIHTHTTKQPSGKFKSSRQIQVEARSKQPESQTESKMKPSPQVPSWRRLKRFLLLAGPIFCLVLCGLQPAAALFNCFTPNMFKMGKVGYPMGQHPGERANWYPQMSLYAGQTYGQNPMSRLFKPKWMGGGGLFGPKRWMDWRMQMAANMNHLYRPNQAAAYWSQPVAPSSFQYNQFADTLNTPLYPAVAPQPFPSMSTSGGPINSKLANSYYSNNNQQPIAQSNINYNNEGWTYPSVLPRPNSQSEQPNVYGGDTYSVSPNSYQTNAKQQTDQYGTKGGGLGGTKTAKKVLVANGI